MQCHCLDSDGLPQSDILAIPGLHAAALAATKCGPLPIGFPRPVPRRLSVPFGQMVEGTGSGWCSSGQPEGSIAEQGTWMQSPGADGGVCGPFPVDRVLKETFVRVLKEMSTG